MPSQAPFKHHSGPPEAPLRLPSCPSQVFLLLPLQAALRLPRALTVPLPRSPQVPLRSFSVVSKALLRPPQSSLKLPSSQIRSSQVFLKPPSALFRAPSGPVRPPVDHRKRRRLGSPLQGPTFLIWKYKYQEISGGLGVQCSGHKACSCPVPVSRSSAAPQSMKPQALLQPAPIVSLSAKVHCDTCAWDPSARMTTREQPTPVLSSGSPSLGKHSSPHRNIASPPPPPMPLPGLSEYLGRSQGVCMEGVKTQL